MPENVKANVKYIFLIFNFDEVKAMDTIFYLFYFTFFHLILFFFKDFIYLFDRDRDSQREREHKQGEWERKKQAHSGGA